MLRKLLALALALASVTFYVGCTSALEGQSRASSGGFGSGVGLEYFGPETLEERIAGADAIVRARLLSASAATEQKSDPTHYLGVVELRFQVLEYLRGSGAGELVALIDDDGIHYDSAAKALEGAKAIRDGRDTQWDNREAILFLFDGEDGELLAEVLPSTRQADRYWLGAVATYPSYEGDDGYSITSYHSKRWLPAAAAPASADAVRDGTKDSGTQLFLLEVPSGGGSIPGDAALQGSSGQAPAGTITLAGMKKLIAANDREIAAGGGSEAYKECLYLKHEWERRASYMKEHYAPFEGGRDYFYIRNDSAINSGLPAGTRAFRDPSRYVGETGTAPAEAGEFFIRGRDAALFSIKWPGVVDTVRPIPAGEYRFYYSYVHREYLICDGEPDLEKKREEVFVTVTAPAGALHEAFFDPTTGTGAVSPAAFRVGGAQAQIQKLLWSGGQVVMELSPYRSLAEYALDVIGLDGSVSLSLNARDATVDTAAGRLTWPVATPPWRVGDKLMLRIREYTPLPELSITGGSGVTEGGRASFTLKASPAPSANLSVSLTLSAAGDYGVPTGKQAVSIPTTGSLALSIPTADDTADEADGSVTATVNAGQGYTVSASQGAATVAISDNDDPPPPDLEATAPAAPTATVLPNGSVLVGWPDYPGVSAYHVRARSSDGHGTQWAYNQTRNWALFKGLKAGAWIIEVLKTDFATGLSGWLVVKVPKPGEAAGAPEISITAGPGVTEGAGASFTVTASPAPASSLAVSLSVSQSGDYAASGTTGSKSVSVPAGGSVTYTVATVNDQADEADGSITVTLAGGQGYTLSSINGASTVAVSDNDASANTPVVSITGGPGVTEGAGASFTVTASPAPASSLAVSLSVSQSGDYAASGTTGSKTVTIPTGGSASYTVATVDDTSDEADGSVSVAVSAGNGYTVGSSSSATVSVSDNDAPPAASCRSAPEPSTGSHPFAAIGALSLDSATADSIAFSWNAVAPVSGKNAEGYAVFYWERGNKGNTRMLCDTVTNTEFTISGLTSKTEYAVRVFVVHNGQARPGNASDVLRQTTK